MVLETSFTRLVGCTVPIQLAGMGSILSPELAAAVSNAGALGQITFAGIDLDEAKVRLDRLTSLTTKPFGVNQLIPYLDRDILELSAHKAKVIDFFWGDPDLELSLTEIARRTGTPTHRSTGRSNVPSKPV